MKIGAIADLIAYRRRHDRTIERIADTTLRSRHGGDFKMYVYANRVEYAEHVALVMGDVSRGGPVMVRMHAMNILDDVLGSIDSGKEGDLQASMELVGKEGRGVIVLIREPRLNYLADMVKAHALGRSPDKSAAARIAGLWRRRANSSRSRRFRDDFVVGYGENHRRHRRLSIEGRRTAID